MLGGALLLCAVGCQSVYKQTTNDVSPNIQPLRATNHVYVALAEDAVYKKETVPNSGRRTALSFIDAFQRQTKNVTLARVTEPLPDALIHARDRGADYILWPTILKWEDHPTEWNGVRDKLSLKAELIEAATGTVVRTTQIDAIGRWLSDGEDGPQDLLASPVDKFVRSLYRVTYTPSALQK